MRIQGSYNNNVLTLDLGYIKEDQSYPQIEVQQEQVTLFEMYPSGCRTTIKTFDTTQGIFTAMNKAIEAAESIIT